MVACCGCGCRFGYLEARLRGRVCRYVIRPSSSVIVCFAEGADYLCAALCIAGVMLMFLRLIMHMIFSIEATRKLHERLLNAVFRYPQSFFDT